ncbi:MAG: sortase domain-containing protein, partial [Mycoplasmatales bacterium]
MKIVLKLINLAIILCIVVIIGYIGLQVFSFYTIKNNEVVNLENAKEKYTAEYCKEGIVTSDKEAINVDEIITNDVIGYVESPEIDLKAAILEGDLFDDQTKAMNSGVSHDPNSSFPYKNGNVVLLGHRNFEFAKLKNIANNNIIILNIKDKIYVYEVY